METIPEYLIRDDTSVKKKCIRDTDSWKLTDDQFH